MTASSRILPRASLRHALMPGVRGPLAQGIMVPVVAQGIGPAHHEYDRLGRRSRVRPFDPAEYRRARLELQNPE